MTPSVPAAKGYAMSSATRGGAAVESPSWSTPPSLIGGHAAAEQGCSKRPPMDASSAGGKPWSAAYPWSCCGCVFHHLSGRYPPTLPPSTTGACAPHAGGVRPPPSSAWKPALLFSSWASLSQRRQPADAGSTGPCIDRLLYAASVLGKAGLKRTSSSCGRRGDSGVSVETLTGTRGDRRRVQGQVTVGHLCVKKRRLQSWDERTSAARMEEQAPQS